MNNQLSSNPVILDASQQISYSCSNI